MRHKVKTVKLGRMSSHRKAMLSTTAKNIILHKRIQTTVPKAHAVVPVIERLVTWAKGGTLHERRKAYRILKDRPLVGKLFNEVAPVMAGKTGGYTRIIKTGHRKGDGASMAILELLGFEKQAEDASKLKKEKKKTKE